MIQNAAIYYNKILIGKSYFKIRKACFENIFSFLKTTAKEVKQRAEMGNKELPL